MHSTKTGKQINSLSMQVILLFPFNRPSYSSLHSTLYLTYY